MEDKNEINKKNEKTEKNENAFSTYSKDFSILLKEKDMLVDLLNSYYELDKYNLDNIAILFERMKQFNDKFLVDPAIPSELKDTPIIRLCKILKEINSSELKYFESLFEYFCKKADMICTFEKFLLYYKNLQLWFSGIEPLKKDLNAAYRNIELRTIDKYIDETLKKKVEREVKINTKKEMKTAKGLENLIQKNRETFKLQHGIDFPSKYLKKAIECLNQFSNSIKEEDKNKLNNLKKEINSIYEISKKGEIYEIWNFDAPRIQSEYKFRLLESNKIPLNDKKDLKEKDILILNDEDKKNILEKIQNIKKDNIVLDLNGKAGIILKIHNLINKILDTNHNNDTISDKEVEELMKLLVNYNNMRTVLIVINDRRNKDKEVKKELLFDILKKIFVKVADYLLYNPNNILADTLTVLSETYYFIDEKKENHYICADIKEHKLFNIDAFWEKLMRYYLDRELYDNKHVTISREKIKNKVLTQDESKKVGNLILAGIGNFHTKVDSFGIPKERVKAMYMKIIDEYQKSVQDCVLDFILVQFDN